MGKKRRSPTKRPPVASPAVDLSSKSNQHTGNGSKGATNAELDTSKAIQKECSVNIGGVELADDVGSLAQVEDPAHEDAPGQTIASGHSDEVWPTPAQAAVSTKKVSGNTVPTVNGTSLMGSEPHSIQGKARTTRTNSGFLSRAAPVVKSWAECVTGKRQSLQMRGDKYRIETGEFCVKIPNTVISRNKKAWANFVLGQFHGNLPSMGALHAILNGIWSNKTRDIAISRAGSQSVLIKIPNASTRKRVLEQGVWHIEGQAMFVAAWEPGLQMEIPELKEVPVWVDFKGVPPHFFSEEGMEYIASLVGQPLQLHPRTAGMLNLEIARVFTLVDLTQQLPEAVYVEFESGERERIEISCPWLPPKCSHCHQFGHSLRRCPTAPIMCNNCRSTTHEATDCYRAKSKSGNQPRRQEQRIWKAVNAEVTTTRDKQQDTQDATGKIQEQTEAENTQVQPDEHLIDRAPVEIQQDPQDISYELAKQTEHTTSERADNHAKIQSETTASGSRSNQGIIINEPVHSEAAPKMMTRALTIKETQASDASIRKSTRVIGKGKSKILSNVESANSYSDEDSYDESDVDMHTVLKNLPASIIKRATRQGKHSKGFDLLENSFY